MCNYTVFKRIFMRKVCNPRTLKSFAITQNENHNIRSGKIMLQVILGKHHNEIKI